MNATLALVIYGLIAISLIGGGLFALKKGFQLVLEGKGKTKEESSVELLGIKASVSSIGSFVMVTAFMWGWAAKLALPSYKDAEVEIHALRQELKQTETALASLKEEYPAKLAQVADLENRLAVASAALAESQKTIIVATDARKQKQEELQALITNQQGRLAELQVAVKKNDRAVIAKKSVEFEEATMAVNETIKDGLF